MINFEGHDVEVFEYNGEALFNPYHVGDCLGLTSSAVRKAITNMNSKQVVKLSNSDVTIGDIRKVIDKGDVAMDDLQVLSNPEFGSVRTIEENGKFLFCGVDVATALGYSNHRDALRRHCKGVVLHDTPLPKIGHRA